MSSRTCRGGRIGPRVHEMNLVDIVDIMLKVNAGAYLFEAGNPRHEHEWKVWENVKVPDGKIIVPGVISHSTPLVEHPELVAQRLTGDETRVDAFGDDRELVEREHLVEIDSRHIATTALCVLGHEFGARQ